MHQMNTTSYITSSGLLLGSWVSEDAPPFCWDVLESMFGARAFVLHAVCVDWRPLPCGLINAYHLHLYNFQTMRTCFYGDDVCSLTWS